MNHELLPMVSLLGERTGRLKDLAGYRKPVGPGGNNSPPPSLGAEEVEAEAGGLFSRIRAALGYKRRDIAFSREGASGMMICRDFDLAIDLRADSGSGEFVLRKTISNIRGEAILEDPAFNELFDNVLQRLELRSSAPVRIEDWIDRIEDLDLEKEWQLQYPPDYSSCSMRLPGSEFEIAVTSAGLVMTRLLPGSPAAFWRDLQKLAPVLPGAAG